MAYAAWLAKITQRPWRLPTDAEWERASQGTYGRSFPWGNHTTPSQTEECDIRVMMPVGSYPQEASHNGVQDMVGLMYEWTDGTIPGYLQPKHAPVADTSVYLALRCGWWGYTAEYAHVAFIRACGFLPDAFTYDLGMRLALAPGA